MPFRNRLLQFGAVLMVTVLSVVFTGTTQAQVVELVLDVGDTSALPGEQVIIPVYLSNYFDTIAGFNFWVQLDRPDIMRFNTVIIDIVDTTYWQCTEWIDELCFDSMMVGAGDAWDFLHIDTNEVDAGGFDTSGTLVSGWEWVDARSLSGNGHDLNVAGIANLFPPPMTPGIPPQEGGVLIKLVADVYDIPDTMTERTVIIHVQTGTLDHFGFSDPWGNSIGLSCGWVPDTSFWLCTQWVGEVCVNWQQVSGPPYDSTSIDSSWVCVLDTNAVQVLDGSVTVLLPPLYGDVNCNGSVDIADLVYVVDYMFLGGLPSPCEENFDCDDDGLITITDLVCLVEWMFPPQ